jgi:hypothetical protein
MIESMGESEKETKCQTSSTRSPWKPVADGFNLNRQATVDAFRSHSLPPGLGLDAVERFLELPAG